MIYPISIPANRVVTMTVPPSSVFFVVSATGTFKAKIGNGSKQVFESGDGFGNPGTKQFRRVSFYDTSGAENDLQVWMANSEYKSPQANVTVPDGVTITNAPTVLPRAALANCADAVPSQFLKTSTAAAAPVALASAATKFRWALVLGRKTESGTPNEGSVWIGASSSASKQPIEIVSGGAWIFPVPSGERWSFGDWFLKVENDGDGVVILHV